MVTRDAGEQHEDRTSGISVQAVEWCDPCCCQRLEMCVALLRPIGLVNTMRARGQVQPPDRIQLAPSILPSRITSSITTSQLLASATIPVSRPSVHTRIALCHSTCGPCMHHSQPILLLPPSTMAILSRRLPPSFRPGGWRPGFPMQ